MTASAQDFRTSPTRRPSLIVNALSNWVTLGANMLVGFIITPYIILRLGTDSFGVYDLALIVVGYSGLLDMGVTSALMRYAARFAGQKDFDSLNRVLNTALLGFVLLGITVFTAVTVFSDPIATLFKVHLEDREVFRTILCLFGLSAGLTFPGTALSVFVLAHEKYVLSNATKIAAALLRGFFSYMVLWAGWGLIALSAVFVGISLFMLIANLLLVRFHIEGARFSPRYVSPSTGRELFSFGFFTFINKSGDILRFRMGQAVIKMFMGFEMVGLYGLGSMVFKNVMKVTVACSGVTQPRLSSLAGMPDLSQFRQAFMRYSIIVSTFTAVIGTMAFLIAPDFLRIWLPQRITDENIRTITLVTFILLVGFLPDVMTNVANNALQAVRKHQFLAYQTAIEGLVNLLLAILLTWHFRNILSVAVAAAIPALVSKLLVQPIYASRIVGVDWKTYVFRVLLKPFAAMAMVIVLFHFLQSATGGALIAKSYVGLLVKAAIIGCVAAWVGGILCFDKDYRRETIGKFAAAGSLIGGRLSLFIKSLRRPQESVAEKP